MAEMLFIEIDKSVFDTNSNVVVGVIYRIPNTDISLFNDKIAHIMSKIKNESKLCYMLGDYNINLLNCDVHQPTHDFVDTCFSNCFIPTINKPTRITKHSATLIDNIITNNIINSSSFHGILLCDISDHFPVFLIEQNLNIKVKEINKKIGILVRTI